MNECMYVYMALAFEQFFSNYLREIRDQNISIVLVQVAVPVPVAI